MHLSPVEYIIHVFGGVRATARMLDKDPSTISKWRYRHKGKIPTRNLKLILQVSLEKKLDIIPQDLILGREVEGFQE